MKHITTWRLLISDEMDRNDESWHDMEIITPKNLDLDRKFDAGYGSVNGLPFTLWTRNRVYFPIEYDGSERVLSVPRNPCDEAVNHGYYEPEYV